MEEEEDFDFSVPKKKSPFLTKDKKPKGDSLFLSTSKEFEVKAELLSRFF